MKQSAGILVFRRNNGKVEVLLAHPGGPFWARKDTWTIPKGELETDEDHVKAAKREFKEELGFDPPEGEPIELGSLKASSKENFIWAVEGNPDLSLFAPNDMVEVEWPPHSGEIQRFSENDRIAWFELGKAKTKLYKNQIGFIDRLAEKLGIETLDPPEQASLF